MMKRYSLIFCFLAVMGLGCSHHDDSHEYECEIDEIYNDEGECVKCNQYVDASDNGYHLDDEGRCEIDSDNACGEERIDCLALNYVSEAHCHKGSCVIDKCTDDYIVVNNICEHNVDADFDGINNPFDPCPIKPPT